MKDIQQRIEVFEHSQKQYYNTIKTTTQQLNTSHVNISINTIKQNIDDIVAEKIKHFEDNLNQVVDEMLQDVYAASEEATNAFHLATETHLKEFTEKLLETSRNETNESKQKPPQFHVTLDKKFVHSQNPFKSM
jgi:hypothetical protein